MVLVRQHGGDIQSSAPPLVRKAVPVKSRQEFSVAATTIRDIYANNRFSFRVKERAFPGRLYRRGVKMFSEKFYAELIERFTRIEELDDQRFRRSWSACVNTTIADSVCDLVCDRFGSDAERMAGMDLGYRSQEALMSAAGMAHIFQVLIQRAMLSPTDIIRVVDCCSVKNIAFAAELVRRMLDNIRQLIPLASSRLIRMSHQADVIPLDRKPDEMSLRALAFLTLAEAGTRYASALLDAADAQQECIETLWNWRLGSPSRQKLHRYEDAMNAMTAAIRRIKAGDSEAC
jgi:hypothetical protein